MMINAASTTPTGRGQVKATEEERDLVRRMRAGDQTAFETFSDHYIPALYRFASTRLAGQRELTRDLVQATVCKVIEGLDSYRGDSSLFTWLCACCRNEIAGHFRREQSRPVASVDLCDETSPATGTPGFERASPEELLLRTEAASLVQLALDHLPPRYAAALEWKYLQYTSVREIADRLSMKEKAAESLLTRARKAFREAYERLGEATLSRDRVET